MTTIQTILAATDFSADAHRAVRRAALLAGSHGARLQLLHVMEADALEELRERLRLAVDVRQGLHDDAQRRLEALAEEVRETVGSRPQCLVRTGNVLDEAVAAADYADLLVLGAHGTSQMRDLLLGTTAERLLLKSRRPMLVVKGEPQSSYRKVLVPVDFSVHSLATLRFAWQIAPAAHVKIFHAYENPYEGKLVQADVSAGIIEQFLMESRDQALANIANLIDKAVPADSQVSSSIERGDAKFLIPAEAVKLGADLIVIGKHGRSLLGEFFLGGATRATVARATCDVLVVPDRARL